MNKVMRVLKEQQEHIDKCHELIEREKNIIDETIDLNKKLMAVLAHIRKLLEETAMKRDEHVNRDLYKWIISQKETELAHYKQEAEAIPEICQFAPCEPGACGITICPNWRDADA